MILAFDPGICTGWATLDMNSELVSCGVIEWKDFHFVVPPEFFQPFPIGRRALISRVVEIPQVYRTGRQKGAQSDVIDTALRAGLLLGWARAEFWANSERLPTPHEWKKSVPKEIHHPRILAELSSEERARIPKLPKSKLHNCLDAIGLAKWAAR